MANRQLYKGRIVDLWLEEAALPNGSTVSLEVIHHPGASAIAAIHDDGSVTLIRQFRHAAGGFIWELPAGKLDPGEAPALCAARELAEETGLAAGELIELGSVLTTPGFCDERIYLFLARQLTEVPQRLDHDEILTVTRMPFDEALAMIRDGRLQDAKSIAGLFLADAFLKTG